MILLHFLLIKSFNGNLWFKHFPDQVMAKDKRPGVAAVFTALYPDEDKDKEKVNYLSVDDLRLLAFRLKRWKRS